MAMNLLRVAFSLLIFAAATHGSTLTGTVRDSEGAVIADARVVATPLDAGRCARRGTRV